MSQLICPVLLLVQGATAGLARCREATCAWWDAPAARCAVLLQAQHMQMAADVLDAMVADDGAVCIHIMDE